MEGKAAAGGIGKTPDHDWKGKGFRVNRVTVVEALGGVHAQPLIYFSNMVFMHP